MDAVSDRDYVIETTFMFTLLLTHLSRCECMLADLVAQELAKMQARLLMLATSS